ncbi:hypothetical protein LTR24_010618 [Lithohypha guttulata]|uniref:Uncharacterized protein n=1 Tax=Lithohypha guttulata TaxID=1690604 RepID=A0ABR0JTM7_9EURO|nr:hypothetical protein LTR24_010618 [Lithohypha guttulata]
MGRLTSEALRLRGKALECLRMAISSADQVWTHSDVGAIMILRGDAFTPRLAPHQVQWRREGHRGHRTTPKGFLVHRDVLPHGLLDCIEDIVELQEILLNNSDRPVDFFKVDNMQASVESRLASQGPVANAQSPIAECCRLAAFMVCFLTCTETWNNVLVPCKLSDKLQGLVFNSLEDPVWVQHRALQIWLLLVGSCTASLDRGHVEGMKKKWNETLARFTRYLFKFPELDMNNEALTSALEDFIYCRDWLRKRQEVREWFVLETALDL